MHSVIGTAKLKGIDPQAWLADAIARISDLPVSRLPELMPCPSCCRDGVDARHPNRDAGMSNKEAEKMIARIGIDIAKNMFHVHGVCAAGQHLTSRKLRRFQVFAFFGKLDPCVVGMKACATSPNGRGRSLRSATRSG